MATSRLPLRSARLPTAHGRPGRRRPTAGGVKYQKITHPTQPEASGGGAEATRTMLAKWNAALEALHPLAHPDRSRPLRRYGEDFRAGEKLPIPG
jgi:hypothetical protein